MRFGHRRVGSALTLFTAFLRRPKEAPSGAAGNELQVIGARGGPNPRSASLADLERRLAAALDAAEFARSFVTELESDILRTRDPENAFPREPEGLIKEPANPAVPIEVSEAAVAAAYRALRAEIEERLEALQRREAGVRAKEAELEAARSGMKEFKQRLSDSIAQLAQDQARLEQIRRELAARLHEVVPKSGDKTDAG